MTNVSKWQDIKQRIRLFGKTAAECTSFQMPVHFKFSDLNDQYKRLYFLGTLNGQISFTLIQTDFPKDGSFQNDGDTNNLVCKPCWSTDSSLRSSKPLSREQELLRERMRVRTSGITSYTLTEYNENDSKFAQLVFLAGNTLNVFRDVSDIEDCFPKELTMESEDSILSPLTCPDNSDLICFIRNGDLYVKYSSSPEVRLTFLRKVQSSSILENTKSAGMPSFVVQEEFDRYVGYWWRPSAVNKTEKDSRYQILYEEIDESNVDILNIVSYETLGLSVDPYRYPRPGTKNATSTVKIVEFLCIDGMVSDVKQRQLDKPLFGIFDDMEYLLNAGWLPDRKSIFVEMTDRLQTVKKLFMIPLDNFSVSNPDESVEVMETEQTANVYYLLREEKSPDLWLHTNELLYFFQPLQSSNSSIISFISGSEVSGFLHLHYVTVDLKDAKPLNNSKGILCPNNVNESPLTTGGWEVGSKQLWVDEESSLVYFMGYMDTPLETHLYATSYAHPQHIKGPIRLTELGYSHIVEMDESCKYFVATKSSVARPHSCEVYSINVESNDDSKISIKSIKVGSLVTPAKNAFIETAELFKYDSSCNSEFYGMVFRPNDDTACHSGATNGKFPVVLNVYGGPQIQYISNSYTLQKHFIAHKLAHFGYAVVIIDGRGSAHRGNKFEGHLKEQLGNVEIADQIETLQWLGQKYNFLDLDRVAIMGWSYGGYLSLMGLVQRPDVFKVAISGAPVTSWLLYDTAYTERFLGLPSENAEIYRRSSVVELASKFPDEEGRLLLIHGLMDENVHFYHTSSLVDALIKASKPYVLQTYPRERHGMRSSESHEHYLAIVISFLMKNL